MTGKLDCSERMTDRQSYSSNAEKFTGKFDCRNIYDRPLIV